MAYYNNYPVGYQLGYNPYTPQAYPYPQATQPQPMQTVQATQPAPQNTPQIQNGGFISVRSEDEARNYPVAPGMSVTFINENAPYCYTKTMGFSQLDRPQFVKYRMIKEEDPQNAPQENAQTVTQSGFDTNTNNNTTETIKAEIGQINAKYDGVVNEVKRLWETVNALSIPVPEPKTTAKAKTTTKAAKEADE